MKRVGWMTAGSLASWLLVAFVSPESRAEVFFGMLGPLVAVSCTWVLVERTVRVNPAGLTSVMMTAFGVKLAFFAVYVAGVLRVGAVDRTLFMVSFTGYFIALYAVTALQIRRLFARLT